MAAKRRPPTKPANRRKLLRDRALREADLLDAWEAARAAGDAARGRTLARELVSMACSRIGEAADFANAGLRWIGPLTADESAAASRIRHVLVAAAGLLDALAWKELRPDAVLAWTAKIERLWIALGVSKLDNRARDELEDALDNFARQPLTLEDAAGAVRQVFARDFPDLAARLRPETILAAVEACRRPGRGLQSKWNAINALEAEAGLKSADPKERRKRRRRDARRRSPA